MLSLGGLIGFALIMGLFGLAILIVLWPGERQGKKVLARWGVAEPSEAEVAVAVRYLKRRRFWYPWLWLTLPVLPRLVGLDLPDSNSLGTIFATLLVGGLLAELFAQRPSRGPRREALLEHRGILDFAPAWVLILTGITELAAVVNLSFTVAGARLVLAVAAIAVSWLMLLLAVRRPAAGPERADLALRCRSARVALGLGVGAAAGLAWIVGDLPSMLGFVVSLAVFIAIASPPGKLPAKTAHAG